MWHPLRTSLCWIALAACSPAPAPVIAPAANPTPSLASASTATAAEDQGGETPANNSAEPAAPAAKSFAELRSAVMACSVTEDGSIADDCEAHQAWLAEEPALVGPKAISELLSMLSAAEAKSRRLAAERLRLSLNDTNLDAASADRLIDACEKERDEALMSTMVDMLSGQNLVAVGKIDRAIAVAKAHPSAEFTEMFLLHVGFFNRGKALVSWAREASQSKSSRIRNAALSTASYHASEFPDEACKIINALRADKDKFVKDRARTSLASGKKCLAYFDKLLDDLSTVKLKPNTDREIGVDQSYGAALQSLCANSQLSATQRSRATKASQRLAAATAVNGGTRYYALSAVVRCDPTNGKSFVAQFANDKDATVASQATQLSK